jgi:hypothetical protein
MHLKRCQRYLKTLFKGGHCRYRASHWRTNRRGIFTPKTTPTFADRRGRRSPCLTPRQHVAMICSITASRRPGTLYPGGWETKPGSISPWWVVSLLPAKKPSNASTPPRTASLGLGCPLVRCLVSVLSGHYHHPHHCTHTQKRSLVPDA